MTAPAGKGDAAGQDASMPRCIVWLALDQAAPHPLLAALEQRGVGVALAGDAADVMRQLAAAPTLTVIIIEPARQSRLRELCEAVTQYYPRTPLWRYETHPSEGASTLAPFSLPEAESPGSGDGVDDGEGDPDVPEETGAAPPSPLQPPVPFADAVPSHAADDDDDDSQGRPHLASLTSEELAMLLGDEGDPPSPVQ